MTMPKELSSLIKEGNFNPSQVSVIEDGENVMRPDVMNFLMLASIASQAVRIRKALEREQFQGKFDTRYESVDENLKSIDIVEDWPWISCFIINYGPDTVRVQINGPPWIWLRIRPNETRTLDQTHADERIKRISCICDPGETALLEVEGVY